MRSASVATSRARPTQLQWWVDVMMVRASRVAILHAVRAESLEKIKEKNTHLRNMCVFIVEKHKVHKPANSVWKRKDKTSTTKRNGIT